MRYQRNFNDYKLVLEILYEEHKKHTKRWLDLTEKEHYNFKKIEVRHICSSNPDDIDDFIDEDFLRYLDDYKASLGKLYAQILYRIERETSFILGGRIKNDDSILFKLHRKRFEDGGTYPLRKYLNDLLGFRLIDSNFESNLSELPQYLEHLKSKNKRIRHRYNEKGKYKGYHIYFMGENNKHFPMELQVWDLKQERINLTSHENYKKEYTYWPVIYKKG